MYSIKIAICLFAAVPLALLGASLTGHVARNVRPLMMISSVLVVGALWMVANHYVVISLGTYPMLRP